MSYPNLIPSHSAATAKQRLGLAISSNPESQARLRLVQQGPELHHAVSLNAPQPPAPPPAKITRWGQLRQRLSRLTAFRHTILGGVIEVMDGVRQFMGPAAFIARNVKHVILGLLTVAVPLGVATLLWQHVPGWSAAFPLRSPLGWAFLAGLTIAVGFLGLVFAVLVRGAVRSVRQGSLRLSSKGEKAFD
jgi:hypothetical protein